MHPISFNAGYALERSRLTVFFRILLAIPWLIAVYLWAIAAYLIAVVSWFAMMFTGRHPEGLYGFIASFLRFSGRSAGWMFLLTDDFPPFSGRADDSYPVAIDVEPPQGRYSRAKTFFKIVLYFPQYLLGQAAATLLAAGSFITWWRVLFTGKQSATMHDALRAGLAYHLRSMGFLLLLTETHPRLLELPTLEYPPSAPALPHPSGGAGPAGEALTAGSGEAPEQRPAQ